MMQEIKLTQIQENSGQVEGLPQNPRQIDAQKFELLKDNITKYPEMLSFRGLMVYEYKKSTFVVIGGNMRFRALKDLQHKSAPCVVLPKETPIEKLRAYAMLDNNNFGQWDYALKQDKNSTKKDYAIFTQPF